jgi:hypothetical protein
MDAMDEHRTDTENDAIWLLAGALLRKKGVEPEKATYEQFSEAALVAAEVVAAKGTTATVPDMLAHAALPQGLPTDERTLPLLAKFATDGRFVADLSIDERDFLAAAIAAERERDERETVAADEDTVLAEAGFDGPRCPTCGKDDLWCGCGGGLTDASDA